LARWAEMKRARPERATVGIRLSCDSRSRAKSRDRRARGGPNERLGNNDILSVESSGR
jgi:hypothetical protein